MSEVITAVYEKGVLRPLHPLNLREKEMVRLQVLPAEPVDEVEKITPSALKPQILAALSSTGIVTVPKPSVSLQPRFRRTPVKAGGKPASEMIIKERREGT